VTHRGEIAGSRGIDLAVGGLAPIAVGALLVPLRDEIDNTNLALILVLVVVVVAIVGGRAACALAAESRDGSAMWCSTRSAR
jgi:hypothetical protein